MKKLLLALLVSCFALGRSQAQTPADKPVVKLDPALDALISPDAKLELVKNDFGFTEGIVWIDQGAGGYMLLSDMYANVIYKLTPDGQVSLYLDHSSYTGYDIWRVGMPQPDTDRKDVFFMIGSNGLAFSPDEKVLYANGSQNKYVRRYDVQPDDTLTNSQMFIDMSSDPAGGITDGMKVDTEGNVWESGPRGIWIMSPEGKHLGTILTPEFVANLCFGNHDNKTLYVAARTGVYKIRVNVPGLR